MVIKIPRLFWEDCTEENDMRETVEKVEKAYRNFLIERGLPQMSAYELISEDFYDDYERRVITKFIELFEAIDSEKKSWVND